MQRIKNMEKKIGLLQPGDKLELEIDGNKTIETVKLVKDHPLTHGHAIIEFESGAWTMEDYSSTVVLKN